MTLQLFTQHKEDKNLDLIVITRLENLKDEVKIIKELFDNDLELLLWRKDSLHNFEHIELEPKYLKKTEQYNPKHTFHSFEEIENFDKKIQFGFLSPIFDSISKPDYKSNFTEEELVSFFKKRSQTNDHKVKKLYALGGICPNYIKKSKEIGFDGIGVVGGIWQIPDPVKAFLEYKAICSNLKKGF